jgi:hypothetical protein
MSTPVEAFTKELLKVSLSCAVPLRIQELHNRYPKDTHQAVQESLQEDILCLECRGRPKEELPARQQGKDKECITCAGKHYLPRNVAYSYYLASHGDNILYRSKTKGDTANAFNVLADSLARMSFIPGGVTIMDLSFCTQRVGSGAVAIRSSNVPICTNSVTEFAKKLRKVEFTKKLRKVK